jgi:FKBP-type peptidyl-prolyl cis-trans isomerase SlyD
MTADTIRNGKIVSLTYTLVNQRGEVFEQSDVPISYLHGHNSGLFDKIERSLEGKQPGDQVQITLTPEEGFGLRDPGLTFTDDVENVPPELRYIGAQLEAQNSKGEVLTFLVTDIQNGKLTVDANHPLAGQTVQFNVTVSSVREPTAEELKRGLPDGASYVQ